MKKLLTSLAVAMLLSVGTIAGASEPAPAAAEPGLANPFDPNVWMAAFAGATPPTISGEVKFNAAHPSAWMSIVDPSTHMQMHAMFANPASYTQFMQPRFYMEFMKPENMMAWMNPASYQVMMQQQTMNYWMNPDAYTHMVDPAMYQQTMNPANYMLYMNPNTYTALLAAQSCDNAAPGAAPGWFGC